MARRVALACCLLVPAVALGQTTTSGLTITETNDQDREINIAECQGTVSDGLVFTWTISVTNFVSGTYALLASTQSSCPTGTTTGATTITIADGIDASTSSGAYPRGGNVNVPTLLGQLGINCSGAATSVFFCVNYTPSSGAAVPNAVTNSIPLDLARPLAPTISSITPGDTALNVSWTGGSTGSSVDGGTIGSANSYEVTAVSQADANDTHKVTVTNATSARVTGLTNGTTYDVTVVGISPGGNRSDPSAVQSGTPVEVLDFWRLYHSEGGREMGGCATGAAGLAALLALLPLAVRRHHRGKRS